MKANAKLAAFNFFWIGLIIFIFIILGVACLFNQGKAGYNQNALLIYGFGSVLAIFICIVFGAFGVFNTVRVKSTARNIFSVGHVSESHPYLFLSNNIYLKIIPHLIWASIVLIFAVSGFTIWAEPDVYSGISEFATASSTEPLATQEVGFFRSLFDTALLPAFVEDMSAFALSAGIVILILLWVWFMGKVTRSKFFSINAFWNIIAIIIACPIASSFFSGAHELAQGGNILFFFSAWLFQTINLYVMWFTGFFFPLAHFLHNSIFILGFSFALSIAFIVIPFINYKKLVSFLKIKNIWRSGN